MLFFIGLIQQIHIHERVKIDTYPHVHAYKQTNTQMYTHTHWGKSAFLWSVATKKRLEASVFEQDDQCREQGSFRGEPYRENLTQILWKPEETVDSQVHRNADLKTKGYSRSGDANSPVMTRQRTMTTLATMTTMTTISM